MNFSGRWRPRRVTVLCILMIAILCGLFLPYFGYRVSSYWIVMVPLAAIVVVHKRKHATIILPIVGIGLLIGVLRGQVVSNQLQQYDTLFGRTAEYTGRTTDDTSYDINRNQTIVHMSSIRTGSKSLVGRVQVSAPGEVYITRGSEIRVTGKLKPAKGTTTQAYLSFGKLSILHPNTSWTEKFRSRFFRAVHNALPEPQSSLGLGYLVGLRVDIPKTLADQLAIVGLTHIVAVSGYNLTIIVQAIRRLLGKRSAYQSVAIASGLIIAFIVVTGASASINRAAIVCGFSLLAWYYGRKFHPLLLLLLSGVITAYISPLYIWGDPGWYLSFLAFGGVMLLAPAVTQRIYKAKRPSILSQILIETISAQLFTIPYSLFLFGGVSLIAPIANVLVLPFIPLVMLLVFGVGIVGLVSPVLAYWMGSIPASILTVQIWIIEKLSVVPKAHIDLTASIILCGLLFSVVALVTHLLWRGSDRAQLEQNWDLV